MDWIHCNDCFKQPHLSVGTAFYLTSCSRIQCSACYKSNSCSLRECPPCRAQNYAGCRLDDKMPPVVEEYFCNPLDHLKKFLKIYDFQRKHRDSLNAYLVKTRKDEESKVTQWQHTIGDLQQQLQRAGAELQSREQEISSLKNLIHQMRAEINLPSNRGHRETPEMRNELRPDANVSTNPTDTASLIARLNQKYSNASRSVGNSDFKIPTSTNLAAAKRGENRGHAFSGPKNPMFAVQHPAAKAVPSRQPPELVRQPPPKGPSQFFNPQTPAYFPSFTPQQKRFGSQLLAPKLLRPEVPSSRQPTSASEKPANQPGSTYDDVFAYLSDVARKATTPSPKRNSLN